MNQLQIPCLGLPFKLGMLYDCRTNELISGITLWKQETLSKLPATTTQETSRFELVSEDTFNQKAFHLGAGADLQLGILSGLVQAGGAAEFLYDRKRSKNMSRVTLNYKSTTKYEQLTMDQLGMVEHPEIYDKGIATHVVTGVVYGADAFFVLDQEVSKHQDVKKVEGKIGLKIKKFLPLDSIPPIDGSASFTAEDEGDEKKLTCRYFGDAILNKYPTTYQEAIKVCRELPNLLKGKAVAKKAWLLPLADLDTRCQRFAHEADNLFSKLVFQKIQELFEYLNEVEVSTNDLLQNEASLYFTGINKELNRLKRLVNTYALSMKRKIAFLLPQIRAGKVPAVKIEDVIKQNSLSPFSQEHLSSLIREKEQEIRYLSQYLVFIKHEELIHFAFKDGELDSVFDFNDARDVVCLDFNIHWGNNNVMNRMEAYLQEEKRDKKKPKSTHEFWCTESAVATIKQQIQLFVGHVKANRCTPGMKYVVTNGQSKLAKQASDKLAIISFYQSSSSPIEFQPLGPPGKPHAETVTSDSVCLTWQASKHGSKNITGYTVSYSYEENNWFDVKAILGRYDLQNPVFVSTKLAPNTTYRFKVQANNANGNGPYSSLSEGITTKPPVALKEKYQPRCKLVNEKIPKVYKLPTHATFQSDLFQKRDAVATLSSVSAVAPHKVVMLVGATGSGKTTLINAMTNYILGVKWQDDYRFKLITEKTSDDQTKSQTKLITAYTFHKEDGYPYHIL